MNHREIISNFASRKVNSKLNSVRWGGNSNNVFCIDKVLYSYGHHFPLAKYLGIQDSEHFFIKNSDKYSSSTSRHQSMTRGVCKGPLISAMGLYNLTKKNFSCLEFEHILFWRPGFVKCAYQDKENQIFYEYSDQEFDLSVEVPKNLVDDNEFDVVDLNPSTLNLKKISLNPNTKFHFKAASRNHRCLSLTSLTYGLLSSPQVCVLKLENEIFCFLDSDLVELPEIPESLEQAESWAIENLKRS